MKKWIVMMVLISAAMSFAQERTFEVTVTNLTKAQIFAPPVLVTHDGSHKMYRLGYAPSEALATMAEDGDASGLRDNALAADGVTAAIVGDDVIMPGATATYTVTSSGYADYLSIAGMLVTTNDAFFGASIRLPGIALFKNGTGLNRSAMASVYDAGSEANTESCDHIPGPPCGNGGVRVTDGAEGFVHPHSGIHGIADVAPATYDWGNSAAMISIRAM